MATAGPLPVATPVPWVAAEDGVKGSYAYAASYGCEPQKLSWRAVKKWFVDNKTECLAGVTTGLASVPTSVAYSVLARLDPQVGLRGSWIIMLIMAVCNARTGLVYCNSGAMGAVIATLVTRHGVGYVLYAFMFAGILQVIVGLLNAHKLLRLLPASVMVGFVDGLAIVLLLAQVRNFQVWSLSSGATNQNGGGAAGGRRLENSFTVFTDGAEWITGPELGYILLEVCCTILAIVLSERLSRSMPSLLMGLVAATVVEWAIVRAAIGSQTPTLGDVANVGGGLPKFAWLYSSIDMPPLSSATFAAIAPAGLSLMAIGLIESLMTTRLVNEVLQSSANKKSEAIWGGVANFVAGVLGGQGGNSEIGLTMINLKSGGGFTRLPALISAVILLIVVLVASPAINIIPLSAITGVIVAVVCRTFDWGSLRLVAASLCPKRLQRGFVGRFLDESQRNVGPADAFIIVVTTVLTPFTNLAIAVAGGVGVALLTYGWQSANRVNVTAEARAGDAKNDEPAVVRVYVVDGPVFFGSVDRFLAAFDPRGDPDVCEVLLHGADICDYSAVQAINTLGERYGVRNKRLRLRRVRNASQRVIRDAHDLLREEVVVEFGEEEQPSPTAHLHREGDPWELRQLQLAKEKERERRVRSSSSAAGHVDEFDSHPHYYYHGSSRRFVLEEHKGDRVTVHGNGTMAPSRAVTEQNSDDHLDRRREAFSPTSSSSTLHDYQREGPERASESLAGRRRTSMAQLEDGGPYYRPGSATGSGLAYYAEYDGGGDAAV